MPQMDGITATKHIMKYCEDNKIDKPIICALTAYDNLDNQRSCIEAGMNRVLTKPFKPKEMSDIID